MHTTIQFQLSTLSNNRAVSYTKRDSLAFIETFRSVYPDHVNVKDLVYKGYVFPHLKLVDISADTHNDLLALRRLFEIGLKQIHPRYKYIVRTSNFL